MPCTFSHPLAVVPLRRFCPERLNFAALVIGCMAPDFPYYLQLFPLATRAHSLVGSFTASLPLGLVTLLLFYLLRRPYCYLLPQPHRRALLQLASKGAGFTPLALLKAAASVLIGAWTHNVWDSFTHESGWVVEHVWLLRAPVIGTGPESIRLYYLLQQTSTVAAGGVLVWLYVSWLRRQATQAGPELPGGARDSDLGRYGLLAAFTISALMLASATALSLASSFQSYMAVRVFLFRTAVYASGIFTIEFTLAAVVIYAGSKALRVGRSPRR